MHGVTRTCFLGFPFFADFAIFKKSAKTYQTSTTPSCGGPLRAQIFRKVCFYEQKYDFWLVRVPFALFKIPPLNSSKNRNFQKWYSLLFSFVTLSLLAKNYVSITKIVNFGPLGPFCPFWKGPRTHQKRKFSKITISSVLLCHTEPTYQKLCFYHQNYGF